MASLVETAPINRAEPRAGSALGLAVSPRAARGVLTGLAIVLPFERPLGEVAGVMTVTTVEMAAIVAVVASALAIAGGRMPLQWPPWRLAGFCLLGVFALAALAAPFERGNAMRLVGRLAMAATVILAVATLVTHVDHARRLAWALLSTAAGVAVLAVLEVAEVPIVMNLLTTFRPGFHVVGGQLRATGTLFYPTIASMYLEVAFACGLWLLLDPTRGRVARLSALVALALVGAGITATFTRAGLIGMAAAIVVTGLIARSRGGLDRPRMMSLGGLVAAVCAAVLILHSPERLAARLTTEGSRAWYGVIYEVPPTLALETGRVHRVPITLTNTGRLTWDSNRAPGFNVSYHWLRAGSEVVVQFEGQRTPFAAPVAPGQAVSLLADVIAPSAPGEYTLVWDVVHETRAWLSTEGVTPARTAARVDGAVVPAMPTRLTRLPSTAVRHDRPALWRAGLAMASDHPWLGVGPDNFRLGYGRYLGVTAADSRIHANSLYLETLTGAGVGGLAALVWLLAASGRALLTRCRTVLPAEVIPSAALLSAWLMVAGHGLVDSFLSFTTTYLLFAMTAGLAFARAWVPAPPVLPALPARSPHHAHRV